MLCVQGKVLLCFVCVSLADFSGLLRFQIVSWLHTTWNSTQVTHNWEIFFLSVTDSQHYHAELKVVAPHHARYLGVALPPACCTGTPRNNNKILLLVLFYCITGPSALSVFYYSSSNFRSFDKNEKENFLRDTFSFKSSKFQSEIIMSTLLWMDSYLKSARCGGRRDIFSLRLQGRSADV